MALDAVLSYVHFMAIFVLFAFLSIELILLKGALDADRVRTLGRMDLWYFGAAIAALASGLLRAYLGAKGPAFYFGAWPIHAKIALFFVVAAMSVAPTLAFRRWRRAQAQDPAWKVPAAEQDRMRRLVLAEVHLAALIPALAVVMARGMGH